MIVSKANFYVEIALGHFEHKPKKVSTESVLVDERLAFVDSCSFQACNAIPSSQ